MSVKSRNYFALRYSHICLERLDNTANGIQLTRTDSEIDIVNLISITITGTLFAPRSDIKHGSEEKSDVHKFYLIL